MSESRHDVQKRVQELASWPRPLVVRRGPQFPLALGAHILICLVAWAPGLFLFVHGAEAVFLPRAAVWWGQQVPGATITRTYKHGQEYRFAYSCPWNGQTVSGDDEIGYLEWKKLATGQTGTALVLSRGNRVWYTRFQLPQTEDVSDLDVISLIFCLMGFGLMALGVYVVWMLLSAPRFLANAHAAVGSVDSSGSKATVYSYYVNGQTYRRMGGAGPLSQRHGDVVLVMYDPKKPKRSTIFYEGVYVLEPPEGRGRHEHDSEGHKQRQDRHEHP